MREPASLLQRLLRLAKTARLSRPRALENQTLAKNQRCTPKAVRPTAVRAFDGAAKGRCHGRNRIARLMQERALRSAEGRFRVKPPTATMTSPLPQPSGRSSKATAPNQIWVRYYLHSNQEGWLYVAAILDLYSRKIVGWAMSVTIDTAPVLKALAWPVIVTTRDLPLPPDRGVQHASKDYRQPSTRPASSPR